MKKILKWALALLVVAVFVYMTYGTGTEQAAVNSVYPPLSPAADGRPQIAAHYLELGEDGQVKLALQVLAPGSNIEAVRIDNVGGQASLWRSDSDDSEAKPITVSNKGQVLSSAGGKMNLGPLGKAEEYLEFALPDNGAFKGGQTEFRVTVFLAGGERANCLLPAFNSAMLPVTPEPVVVTAAPQEPRIQEEAKSEEAPPEEDQSLIAKLKEQFFPAAKPQAEGEPSPIAETQLDNEQSTQGPSWWSEIFSWVDFSDRNSPYMPYNGWWNACRRGKDQIIGQNHSGTETYEGCVISRVVYYPEEGFMYEKANEIALAIARAAASMLERKREYSKDDKDIIVEISGYLNIEEAGTHTLSVIRRNITNKSVIDDAVICIDNEDCIDSKDSVFSTKAELNPGLHTITFSIELPFEDFESEPNPLHYIDITLQRPSDAKELPISDFLLGKKMSAEEMKELEEKMEQLKEAQDAADDEKFSDKVKDHISDIIADTIKKVL